MNFVYPRGTDSVSSLLFFAGWFFFLPLASYFASLSLGAHLIQGYLNKKRGRKRKVIKPHQEKVRHEERMKRGNVIVQAKLGVGY